MNHQDILNMKMNRKGFGLKESIQEDLAKHYHSDTIEVIKAEGFSKTFGDLTIHLAREFGFCYGVDRAVMLAYETISQFPEKKIFLTTEIIHNPVVNKNLQNMGVHFLSGPYQDSKLEDITKDDVVIVPAFGTTVSLLSKLVDIECELVDTICASVIVVWKRVERYAKDGFTVLVHGKYFHEETQATISRVEAMGGQYLVVFNEEEARYVCRYITEGGSREDFSKKFERATSSNFDPTTGLQKIGLANQTTMLSSESLKIGQMVKDAMIEKYGEDQIKEHYRSFDTICNATQERQDAIVSLKEKNLDSIVVIGGYNSSNTNHLCQMASSVAPTYHIDRAECIVSRSIIHHKPQGTKDEVITENWLKSGPVSIGITAGASTPNQVMGETIERIVNFYCGEQ